MHSGAWHNSGEPIGADPGLISDQRIYWRRTQLCPPNNSGGFLAVRNNHKNVFFLVSNNLKTMKLNKKQPISIGREKFNDVVLNDIGVSRQHAIIGWEDGRFYIKDLGSSNGTFLNDKHIEKETIGDGDTINICSQEFVIRDASNMNVEDFLVKEQSRMGSEETQVFVLPPISINEGGFSGDLSTLAIIEVVQTLSQCLKSGALTINQPGNPKDSAVLYFNEGDIVHAEHPSVQGVAAVERVLRLQIGQFVFSNDVVSPKHTIEESTMSILMAACRAIDENP